VGIYLIGQATEKKIYFGIISDKTGKRNNNVVEVYLIGQTTERVILWGYI